MLCSSTVTVDSGELAFPFELLILQFIIPHMFPLRDKETKTMSDKPSSLRPCHKDHFRIYMKIFCYFLFQCSRRAEETVYTGVC